MTKEYKMTSLIKRNYYYRTQLVTFFIHMLGLLALLYFKNIKEFYLITIISLAVVFGWIMIFALPLFLLYSNHRRFSNGVVLKQEGNFYTYINKNESIKFNIDDIKKVELWLTPPAYDERTDFLYFGKYHFTAIHTKQNQVINISCLVFDKTKEVFPEELIERKKKLFPFMKKNKI